MPCPNYSRKGTISKPFRVSREENERIELLFKAAGVTQQECIMIKLENKKFTVVPGIRTYKLLHDEFRAVYQEICRLRDGSEIDERLSNQLILLSDLFMGIAGEDYKSPLDEEDDMIAGMEHE